MFEPWKGRRFGKGNVVGGCRLLILGESHYTHEPSLVGTTPSKFTEKVLYELAIKGRHPFFGKLQEITTGQPRKMQTREDKTAFWQSVAFYNYVPVLVDGREISDGGARRRPTDAMFRAGATAFQEVRQRLEAQAVIVCGLTLWDYLAPTLQGFDGPTRDIIYYDDGQSVFARIHHPSSMGFRPQKWSKRIHRLIALTAEPRQVGRREVWQAGRSEDS